MRGSTVTTMHPRRRALPPSLLEPPNRPGASATRPK
jgi:hypothetical protein